MGRPITNEVGQQYGPFIVCDSIPPREPSNGVVKWKCKCKRCGNEITFNGNNMRFGKIRRACENCGADR